MEYYKIDLIRYEIEKIEITKETEKCVWCKTTRYNKESNYYKFVETIQEAKNFLLEHIYTVQVCLKENIERQSNKIIELEKIKNVIL